MLGAPVMPLMGGDIQPIATDSADEHAVQPQMEHTDEAQEGKYPCEYQHCDLLTSTPRVNAEWCLVCRSAPVDIGHTCPSRGTVAEAAYFTATGVLKEIDGALDPRELRRYNPRANYCAVRLGNSPQGPLNPVV
jgi:hypothetical protein